MKTPLIDIRPDHWAIVRDILQKHVPQYEVWAFGSRAKWTAKEYSDLDLAVITDRPLGLSVSAALADDFSESDLPWKVDIADWATTSESFRKIIERDKVVVQEARAGRVMAGEWERREIGKAFEVNPTRTIKRGQATPFIPMDALPEHARTPTRIDEREFTGSGVKFQNGDTLIARITPCLENGKTAFVSGLPDGVVAHGSTEYIVLAGKPDESDNLFAYYLARSPDFRNYAIGHMEGTSGRQRVPSVAVENFNIALPPLSEQRAIAHILGTLDDKIELNRRMNETLEAIARAIFKSWFVDFDPIRAKASGEAPESICRRLGLTPDLLALFPDCLVDSELGEIPDGWEVAPLSSVCTRITDGAHTSPKSVDNGRPMASVKDMDDWGFVVSGCRRISEADYQELVRNDCRPLANDVLIAKDGSYLKHIFVVERDLDIVILSSIAILRPNDRIEPHFLTFTLKSETTLARMEQYVSGAALQRIVLKAFREFPIVLPPRMLLDCWAELVSPIIQRCWSNVAESECLASQRDAFLPKLLSGELRVPVEEEAGVTA